MINVTQSYLPPLEEYNSYLVQIWENGILTNNGPLVQELESKLKSYLGVKHLFFVNNGTIALQIAIKALQLKGKIITTPFSYIATTSTIVWESCQPVFADIDPETLCIDPEKVELLIDNNTVAILATHVYGIPCNVNKLEELAAKYNLKIIYDGAHSFGVKVDQCSVLNYGDVSTLSFHATKLFHTIEGGAIITSNDELAHKINYMRNFGHNGPEAFWGVGVNGKNSEFHAAMGLCVLPMVQKFINKRKILCRLYDDLLSDLNFERPIIKGAVEYNYSYYPVVFPSEATLLKVRDALNNNFVIPRRYFYPTLNQLSYVDYLSNPIAESVSLRVLCLPLYYDLTEDQVKFICSIIVSVF